MNPKLTISKMIDIVNPIMSRQNSRSLDFPAEFTFFHTLERLHNNLQTLELLINYTITKYEHAIGLCCRNLLSDFIITGYIVKLSRNIDEYKLNFYRLYYSDLKKTESFLKLYTKTGLVTDEELSKYNNKKNDSTDIYKTVFEHAEEFNLKPFPPITRIIELFIESEMKDLWTMEIINSFDLWTFYSKYEHIGWYSYGMTRDASDSKAIERLNSVLKKTTILLGSCLETLKEEKEYKLASELLKTVYNA